MTIQPIHIEQTLKVPVRLVTKQPLPERLSVPLPMIDALMRIREYARVHPRDENDIYEEQRDRDNE